ncbi:MAG: 2-hydroxychromene-2-carboxylate isomerase [Proteobacteria bacterium]|nr:2-hydroxychromene-2-carboxylate isomerase [Pseudomonadota bacterium]
MAAPALDFWFDFASTYSYPACMRIGPPADQAGVVLRWRPFLLGPIFKAQGFDTSPFNLHPDKGRYMWRDLERLTGDLGLAFRRPHPFPQPSLLATRVAMVGLAADWGAAFCREVFRAQFARGMQIGDAAVVGEILREIGVAPDPVLARAGGEVVKDLLRARTQEARSIGVFGAPTFVTTGGEVFWGNDRLEQALAWAAREN